MANLFSLSPEESGHANESAIDEGAHDEIVFGGGQSSLDCLQRHGLVLGYRVGESQGLALQRFLAKLLVGTRHPGR